MSASIFFQEEHLDLADLGLQMFWNVKAATGAYLLGSIPFGYILVRIFKGRDIRGSGSGNIGATNVARVAPALGIATLLLDVLKGYIAVSWFIASTGLTDSWSHTALSFVASYIGAMAVIGHMFPVWLRFRGGKGVATACGAFGALCPPGILAVLGVFALILASTRYVSLASIIAAASFPLFAYWMNPNTILSWRFVEYRWPMMLPVIAVSILIIAKHHANIRRLLNGTENRFGKKRAEEQIIAED